MRDGDRLRRSDAAGFVEVDYLDVAEPGADWAEADCAAVARTAARARWMGAEAALAAGDRGDATALTEGALDHDQCDEAALRVLMRAYAEDLGVDAAPETGELHTLSMPPYTCADAGMGRDGPVPSAGHQGGQSEDCRRPTAATHQVEYPAHGAGGTTEY